jgi:hypothetical protein
MPDLTKRGPKRTKQNRLHPTLTSKPLLLVKQKPNKLVHSRYQRSSALSSQFPKCLHLLSLFRSSGRWRSARPYSLRVVVFICSTVLHTAVHTHSGKKSVQSAYRLLFLPRMGRPIAVPRYSWTYQSFLPKKLDLCYLSVNRFYDFLYVKFWAVDFVSRSVRSFGIHPR